MDAGEVRYRITADASGATSNVQNFERRIQDTGETIRDTNRQAQDSETQFRDMAESGKSAGNDLTSAFDKVKASVGGLLAALGAAKALDMLGDLTRQCVEAYAEYEQLVGGVETLFKDAAETVQGYAAEAYKNVGISANDYMQTVTSFSASLIASLGGDTAAAAEAANTAMIDMADNANKMGTDIQSIQNAYQGFAKQNYTMLDNLKLGYGGTKEEMERLLADAEQLSGVHYEIGNFADMAEAIHVVQTEMGITGTTAKEAATTISGSANAMKAAWDNLLVGFADGKQEVDGLLSAFTDSVTTFVGNVMPALTETLKALPEGLVNIANEILPIIPDLVQQLLPLVTEGLGELVSAVLDSIGTLGADIVAYTPELLAQLTSIISDIGEHLLSALSQIGDSLSENAGEIIGQLFSSIVEILTNELPQLVTGSAEVAAKIIEGIFDGFAENLPGLLSRIPDIVAAILETFNNLTVSFAEFSLLMFEKMTDALGESLPALLDAIPDVVASILDAFLNLAPRLAEFAAQAIREIHDGLGDNLPELIEKCGEIVGDLVRTLIEKAPGFIEVAVEIVTTIGDALINTDWTGVATDTIESLWKALDRAWNNMQLTGSNASRSDSAKNKFKDFAGIGDKGESEYDELRREVREQNKQTQDTLEEETKATEEKAAAVENSAEKLKAELKDLDHAYAIHQKTEEEYYAEKKDILEKYRDETSEDWWKDYDKVTDYYDKQAKKEADAQAKAAKEQQQAADKAAKEAQNAAKKREQEKTEAEKRLKEETARAMRDMETAADKTGLSDEELLKQQRAYIEGHLDSTSELYKEYDNKLSKQERDAAEKRAKEKEENARKSAAETEAAIKKGLQDKFRDLEIEQLENGYDDKWLSKQKRDFLETLDHDSDLYKEYNLKLLKESEQQAEKEADTLKKANDKIKDAQESLQNSLAYNTGNLFKSTAKTDARTGATDTENSIQIEEFKRQLEAKKKLPEKLAKLLDKGMPDTVIKQLLKLDPTVALEYTNELLSNSQEFNAIKKGLKTDAEINVKLAEIVEGSTGEMTAVGKDIGQALGEGMMEALEGVIKGSMAEMLKKAGISDAALKTINFANSLTGGSLTPMTPVAQNTEAPAQQTQQTQTVFSFPRELSMVIKDVNGAYLARCVNDENLQQATVSGT